MSQTYCYLTSSYEPDIFDINRDQKHTLNQLIHFVLKTGRPNTSGIESIAALILKNSAFHFIPRSWKNIKPSAYSTDYVQKICDKMFSKQEDTASCTVQKNNWLHLTFFPNTMTRTLVLVFFTGHKIIPTIPIKTIHFNTNPKLTTLPFIYNYSTLSPNFTTPSNVTPCSIVACDSIGNAPTDKVYCVLYDSGSSKTLIQKCIICWNFRPIPFTDDLGSFCLQAQQHPWHSWLWKKSGSLNLTAIWLLIAIPLSSLTPRVFAMTSFLVLTFLIHAATH